MQIEMKISETMEQMMKDPKSQIDTYFIEVNGEDYSMTITQKETGVKKVISVEKTISEEVFRCKIENEIDLQIIARLVAEGYFDIQPREVLKEEISDNEFYLIPSYRFRHPEFNFETGLLDIILFVIEQVSVLDISDWDLLVMDFYSYCMRIARQIELQKKEPGIKILTNNGKYAFISSKDSFPDFINVIKKSFITVSNHKGISNKTIITLKRRMRELWTMN